MQIRDALVRAARTALQVVVGVGAVLAGIAAIVPGEFEVFGVNVSDVTNAGTAIIVAVGAALTAFIQNLAEDNTPLPSLK